MFQDVQYFRRNSFQPEKGLTSFNHFHNKISIKSKPKVFLIKIFPIKADFSQIKKKQTFLRIPHAMFRYV